MSAVDELWTFELFDCGSVPFAYLKKGEQKYIRDSDGNRIKIWNVEDGLRAIYMLTTMGANDESLDTSKLGIDVGVILPEEEEMLIEMLCKLGLPFGEEKDESWGLEQKLYNGVPVVLLKRGSGYLYDSDDKERPIAVASIQKLIEIFDELIVEGIMNENEKEELISKARDLGIYEIDDEAIAMIDKNTDDS